jgi:hypothetical protein
MGSFLLLVTASVIVVLALVQVGRVRPVSRTLLRKHGRHGVATPISARGHLFSRIAEVRMQK